MAQKLKRSINMGFRVNEDEKYFIEKKMEAAGWKNFRSFVLHFLIRGEIVKIDLTEIREMNTLLRNISNNINQVIHWVLYRLVLCRKVLYCGLLRSLSFSVVL